MIQSSISPPFSPPETSKLSAMSSPSFAIDKPTPEPFDSEISEDSLLESEILLQMCEKILNDVDSIVLATRSLISDIYEALDAPLFGEYMYCESQSSFPLIEPPFIDSMVCESAPNTPLFYSSFDNPVMPDSEFDCSLSKSRCDDSMVPEIEFEGATKAYGGDRRTLKLKLVVVTAVEMESECMPPLRPGFDEMVRILLRAYFILVRSFPILFMWLVYWDCDAVYGLILYWFSGFNSLVVVLL